MNSGYTIQPDGLPGIPKNASARLDYGRNFSDWLPAGDSIESYSVAADSDEITIESHYRQGAVVVAWLSGGVAGKEYKITFSVVTTAGRIDSRTIKIMVISER